MPVISRFYGIIIKMYFQQSEHSPPHIHAVYNECVGVFDLKSQKMLEGDLPPKALKMVQEWVAMHQIELEKIWETQNFLPIPPLE